MAGSDGDYKVVGAFADHTSVHIVTENVDTSDCFSFVTVRDTKDILDKLNPRKAIGCDTISQRLLRISSPVIAQPLTTLINYFIVKCSWPTVWKSSNIIPVFKKGEQKNKSCYQPVSILTALSKVYERLIVDQVCGQLHSMLSSNVSGYLNGHSCYTAVMKMTEDWRASLNKQETGVAVAIDLSKAFDWVCHGLLHMAYGFSDQAVDLKRDYIKGRKQRVKLGSVCSVRFSLISTSTILTTWFVTLHSGYTLMTQLAMRQILPHWFWNTVFLD